MKILLNWGAICLPNQRPNLHLRKLLNPEGKKKSKWNQWTKHSQSVDTKLDMTLKKKLQIRMHLCIITVQPVCIGLVRHGLQSLQSFSNSISIREIVMNCSPIGKSWTYSRWYSSVCKYAQRLLLLCLKQSTSNFYRTQPTFLEAFGHISLLSI